MTIEAMGIVVMRSLKAFHWIPLYPVRYQRIG
jgi:hypothetical protein